MSKASSDEAFPDLPGLRIEGVLGRGSVATVYRATQPAMNRPVAVKVLKKDVADDERTRERLLREARLAAKLNHPHIVRAHDAGEHRGQIYFVMECVDGTSLREIVRRGPLPLVRALEIVTEIAHALDHLFKHKVVHRDIKPANILVNTAGHALLADLGLAKAEVDTTQTSKDRTVGTPQYMSPEQLMDPRAVDIRSDIFSLGATFYHLVTGSSPFDAESVGAVLTRVLYEMPPPPSVKKDGIPPQYDAVIMKMLAKKKSERYSTPASLLRDLGALAAGEVPLAAAAIVADDQSARRRRSIIVLAAAAAAGAAIIGFALFRQKPAEGPSPRMAPETSPATAASAPRTSSLSDLELAQKCRQGAGPADAETLSELEHRIAAKLAPLRRTAKEKARVRNPKEARRIIDEEPANVILLTFGAAPADLDESLRRFVREFIDLGHKEIDAVLREDQEGALNAVCAALDLAVESLLAEPKYLPPADVERRLLAIEVAEKDLLDADRKKDLGSEVKRRVDRYRTDFLNAFREKLRDADRLTRDGRFAAARAFVDGEEARIVGADLPDAAADVRAARERIDRDEERAALELASAVDRLDRFATGGFPEWKDRRFARATAFIDERISGLPKDKRDLGRGEPAAAALILMNDVLKKTVKRLADVDQALALRAADRPIDIKTTGGDEYPNALIAGIADAAIRLKLADRPDVTLPIAALAIETLQELAPVVDPLDRARSDALLAYAADDFLRVFAIAESAGPADIVLALLSTRAAAGNALVNRVVTDDEKAASVAWNAAVADMRAKSYLSARDRLREIVTNTKWTATAWYGEQKKKILAAYEEAKARVEVEAAIGRRKGRARILDWKSRAIQIEYEFQDVLEAADFKARPKESRIGGGAYQRMSEDPEIAPDRVQALVLDTPIDPGAGPSEVEFTFVCPDDPARPVRGFTVTFAGRVFTVVSRLRRSAGFRHLPLHGLEKSLFEFVDVGAIASWEGAPSGYRAAIQGLLGKEPALLLDPGKSYRVHFAFDPEKKHWEWAVDGRVVLDGTSKGSPGASGEFTFRESMPHELRALRIKGVIGH